MKPRSALVIALIATALGGMPIWLMGAYSPQIVNTYGLDPSTFGAVLAAFFGFSALTGTTIGRYVNTIHWLVGVLLTSVFSVVGLLMLAFVGGGIPLILMGLFIAALANSFSQPSANKGLALHINPSHQGRAFGLKQAALPISTFVVSLTVPLFSTGEDWRYAYASIAVISASLGVYSIIRLGAGRDYLKRSFAKAFDRSTCRWKRKKTGIEPIPRYLKYLAVGAGLGTGSTMSFAGFLVLFAVNRGFTPEQSALVLALGSFVGIFARIYFGFLADKRGRRHFIFVATMMVGGSVGFVVLALTQNLAMLIIGTILGFGMGWAWNGVFHFAVIKVKPESSAFFTGVVQASMAGGATIGPAAFGVLSQQFSFSVAWFFLASTLLLAAAFVLYARKLLPPP